MSFAGPFSELPRNAVSNPTTLSPEIARAFWGKEWSTHMDARAQDVWAVGCIFLYIVTKVYWFDNDMVLDGVQEGALARHQQWVSLESPFCFRYTKVSLIHWFRYTKISLIRFVQQRQPGAGATLNKSKTLSLNKSSVQA